MRLWLWSRFINSIAYGVGRRILTSIFVATLLPFGLLFYLGFLDYFPDEPWVTQNKKLHIGVYTVALLGTGAIQLAKALSDQVRERSPRNSSKTLMELLTAVATIIAAKTQRFRENLHIVEKKPPFDAITQPIEQIAVIVGAAKNLFDRVCPNDGAERFDGTVMHLNNNEWQYVFTYQPNAHRLTDLADLFKFPSTASLALSTSVEQFFPSKNIAARDGKYFVSEHDRLIGGDGSIYCKVVRVATPKGIETFIITFATYGICVCEHWDNESSQAWRLLFQEFSRRIELELILLSIKQFRATVNDSRKQKRKPGSKPKDLGPGQ